MMAFIETLLLLLSVTFPIQAISYAPDVLPLTKTEAKFPDQQDLQLDGSLRKKRCFGNSETTTVAPYSDPDFGHPPKPWDPVEPFVKTNKYFGTTPSPDGRSIQKRMSTNKYLGLFNFQRERRSTLTEQQQSKLPTVLAENQDMLKKEDNNTKTTNEDTTFGQTMKKWMPMDIIDNKFKNTNYEEEKALKKIKIQEHVGNIIRRWNVMRALATIEHRRWNQSNKYIKENKYNIFPDTSMTPVPSPSPIKYFEFANIDEFPYKEAELKWRSLEPKYRL
ncbi:uncharacterized protein LOC113559921 [Rhopalosiphum maidis]|uniref:uncharacterized protein LOC113559921 n=1 Tax=Rhopalosiphum maidis TaxID=43146 RepID=UPI000F003684|nr:uncharacterized protein LOC113559921 [Rhopalosiphum maidis]